MTNIINQRTNNSWSSTILRNTSCMSYGTFASNGTNVSNANGIETHTRHQHLYIWNRYFLHDSERSTGSSVKRRGGPSLLDAGKKSMNSRNLVLFNFKKLKKLRKYWKNIEKILFQRHNVVGECTMRHTTLGCVSFGAAQFLYIIVMNNERCT